MSELAPLHPATRQHLDALSDETGIMQHAIGSLPDPAHGYCTDDVARALQVDLLHQEAFGWDAVAPSARRNLRFLEAALDRSTGRFRNFRRADGAWLDQVASEDCQGRAMHALGTAIASCPDPALVAAAQSLFDAALPTAQGVLALRARASVLLGCDAVLRVAPSTSILRAHRQLADGLASTFASGSPAPWPWPEECLTYEQGLPVRALIVTGRTLRVRSMVDAGRRFLDWLIEIQTEPAGHLSPIGNGWWPYGGPRSRFDQQPIEAATLLLAAEAAYEATGDEAYRVAMERCYAWFLGGNDLGIAVAVPDRGASFDGLTPRGVNLNQGAESTLMWLMASEHLRAIRGQPAALDRADPVPMVVGR